MHVPPSAIADDGRTRDRVSALLLEHGPQTATELAARLGISPAAVRRHLDALVATGRIEERRAGEQHRAPRPRPSGPAVPPHRRRPLGLPARLRRPRADRAALRRRAGWARRRPRGRRAAARRPRGALLDGRPGGGRRPHRGARRPRPGPRRRPHGRGLRCHGLGPLRRRAALPAPLPGGARGRGVPPAVRGGDRGDRPARRHPRAAAGHDRPRRRHLHHTHPRAARAGEQNGPRTTCTR